MYICIFFVSPRVLDNDQHKKIETNFTNYLNSINGFLYDSS